MANLLHSVLPTPRREAQTVTSDITVSDCVKKMTDLNIGSLVVMDKGKFLGLVTERDVIRLCIDCGLNPCKIPVKDITFKDVTILDINDTVEKAMQVMTETRRRHIMVEENGKLVSIISIGDLMAHLLAHSAYEIEQLEKYIHA